MSITLNNPTFSVSVNLGEVTFNYNFTTAPGSAGGNAQAQLFLHRTGINDYPMVQPKNSDGSTLEIALYPNGTANTGSFVGKPPAGSYDSARVILFDPASNYSTVLADFTVACVFTVLTEQLKVTSAQLIVNTAGIINPAPDGKIHIPFTVKYPKLLQNTYNAFFTMAKGTGGFAQNWNEMKNALHNTDPLDDYDVINDVFVLDVPVAGLQNLQFGLFDYNWKMYQWVYPGYTFSVGNWVIPAPVNKIALITDNFKPQGSAPFAIGGNYGNYNEFSDTPANNSVGYFSILVAAGLKVIRNIVDPDRYLIDSSYRDLTDQIVQNILAAGATPIIGAQDMPKGNTLADREKALYSVLSLFVTKYKGQQVAIDIVNEPHEYDWNSFLPVATNAANTMRAIDPNCFIICPFENYSESGLAASNSPLPAGLVNLYAAHTYNLTASTIKAALGTSLPILIEEYNNSDPALHSVLAGMPNIKGVMAWAWTTPGQDSLNLVQSTQGANISYTTVGAGLMDIYSKLISGQSITPPALPPAPPPPPPPPVAPVGLTIADVDAEILKQTASMQSDINLLKQQVAALQPKKLGLKMDYFGNQNLQGSPVTSNIVPLVNFNWVANTAPAVGLPKTNWSARLTGYLTSIATGLYTFSLTVDDGGRLLVNGVNIAESWIAGNSRVITGTALLTAGKPVPIVIEFFQLTGSAQLSLSWKSPLGVSAVIPGWALSQ